MPSLVAQASALFGLLIRARKEKGLTQAAVASVLGMSREKFCRIENARDEATTSQLFVWAHLVGVEISAQRVTSEVSK